MDYRIKAETKQKVSPEPGTGRESEGAPMSGEVKKGMIGQSSRHLPYSA